MADPDRIVDCLPGYFKNGASCDVCPINTWKSTEDTATSCTSCGTGQTTNGATQSTSSAACTRE